MSGKKVNLSLNNSDKVNTVQGLKIAIVVSEWNHKITDRLYNGAFKTLIKNKVKKSDIT